MISMLWATAAPEGWMAAITRWTTALGDSKTRPYSTVASCSLSHYTEMETRELWSWRFCGRWMPGTVLHSHICTWDNKHPLNFCSEAIITNSPITSVLKPMPATYSRSSYWGLHYYTAFLVVSTTPHLEELKGIILSINFQPVEKYTNLVFY